MIDKRKAELLLELIADLYLICSQPEPDPETESEPAPDLSMNGHEPVEAVR